MKENLWSRFLNLFFPRRCACCGQLLAGGALCEGCLLLLKTLESPLLPYTAPLDGLSAAFAYSGAGAALMREFKFHHQTHCYHLLLQESFEKQVRETYEKYNIDMIIPIPMYRDAKRERGFNQAEHIASNLAKSMGVPCRADIMQKVCANRVQHHLSKSERVNNVRGVYQVALPQTVRGKTVLLVDDITTTGATLLECAAVLKAAGAVQVYGAAVLYTPPVQSSKKV
ncbi:ComF family protein [Hydrogenoanaerobacterium sp.]|uniref:ComF family protein n=1 Tax=Hydrogenoanaerobacterium sp. TaxID=2953763 RepID=UPI00289FE1AC|nr:ComF family protein [Hydrogenoanaerobacterium sp.]